MKKGRIAVIGLGVYGLAVADELARDGFDVVGFEQFSIGNARGSSHGRSRIFRRWPGEGRLYSALADEAARGWSRLERESGRMLVHWGGILIAGPAASLFVQESRFLAQTAGAPPEDTNLDAFDIRARFGEGMSFPSDWIACFHHEAGSIRADQALILLARSAAARGARLVSGVRAEIGDAPGQVVCGARTDVFDKVLITAGAWSSELAPELSCILRVEQKTLAWFSPRDAHAPQLGVAAICLDDDTGIFAVVEQDRLKVGLDAVGVTLDSPGQHDQAAITRDLTRLSERVKRFFPTFDPAVCDWSRCLYTLTPDLNFLIHGPKQRPEVLLVSCCSGHGFKYAPAIATHLRNWAAGRHSDMLQSFGLRNRPEPANPVGVAASHPLRRKD